MECANINLIESGFNLVGSMSILSLKPRETGLLDFLPMGWDIKEPKIGQEFKHIYLSRTEQLGRRFD
jgi:hypothetical protein